MSETIEGKVVVITGASSGLGEATARLLSAQGRLRHEPGVVNHDVDSPVRLHGRVDQSLHLVAVGDVGRHGQCLAAAAGQLVGRRFDPLRRRCRASLDDGDGSGFSEAPVVRSRRHAWRQPA